MGSRGQTTIFIVAGIVVVIVFALSFYLAGLGQKHQAPDDSQADAAMINCIEEIARSSVFELGLTGATLSTEANGTGYIINSSTKKALSDEEAERNIEFLIRKNINACFGDEYAKGLNLTVKTPGIAAVINPDNVLISIDDPYTLEGKNTVGDREIPVTVPVRLGRILEMTRAIAERGDGYFSMPDRDGFQISVLDGQDRELWLIEDTLGSYSFRFAVEKT